MNLLQKHWPYGAVDVGSNFGTDCVNYVAKHQVKDCCGDKFQQKVSPIFKRQSRYKGGIGVKYMCRSPAVLRAMTAENDSDKFLESRQGKFIYKVGVPRAVRKKLHPNIRTPVELANLELEGGYQFTKWKADYLLSFPELASMCSNFEDVTDTYTKIIMHSFNEDYKIKMAHKNKKFLEAVQKVNTNINLTDLK